MKDEIKGRQTPTQSVILPYTKTCGARAVEIYNASARTAQEWQELILYDLLAENDDDLWVHTKFGYSVPRRNGKNEVVVMREAYGLVDRAEQILHTAHRTTTTHAAWERLLDILIKVEKYTGITVESTYRAFGKEHITLSNGGNIEFRTRTSKGGLGEGFDLLVIDEAQEYQDDQESALKYVVTDSKNPQTIFTGTPPTPVSSGTVFAKMRSAVLSGGAENSGWAEWSVDGQKTPHDKKWWYETNPSLGTIFTERSVSDEIGTDDVDFNIQRLGLWLRYNQKSAISKNEWDCLKLNILPKFNGKMYVGIKYNHDGESVSMAIALRATDAKIFTEVIDCRSVRAGNSWIIDFLKAVSSSANKIIVDGANGQSILSDEMHDCGLRKPILPTVKQVIAAHAAFEQMLFRGTVCHMGQPSLTQAVSNCEKRAIGSNGGFGYRAIKCGVDISLLDSVILACWAAEEYKEKPNKQRISY